ncbi:MAG TPA: chemotaxis protein CheW [Bacteroidales bacterium]|nr:MAG: chemotaxis protein CheW [Bacteroidetes bacterium GWF2_33_38]OFY74640.1 MAG: chemotaxis protein CheW [Bacteroidetes bacterium RIFOXYA12_FULL_33_9]OFY92255.1 MAG: chemotaxis protein CheW [Bacteroidetes bacterium RIFOXYA2_FULL_33_7]HBF87315.1 chemotaxis protein CheW [Bacteroidales bacterium]
MSAEKMEINSYLSFKLGDEVYAANVSKVLNILEMTKITKVPKAPEYMKGVINLRGSVLPVVDTRIKFGMTPTEYTTNTCILVLEIEIDNDSLHVGGLVDSVQEVLEIEKNQILPPPNIGNKFKSQFITGMYKMGDDQFIMILDMDKIFTIDDLLALKDNADVSVS